MGAGTRDREHRRRAHRPRRIARYFRAPPEREIHSKAAMHGIRGLDIKGWHSVIVAAGSIHPDTGRRYTYVPGKEFLAIDSLPFFDPTWLPEDLRPASCAVANAPATRTRTLPFLGKHRVRDVRRYIRAIRSVEGRGGSNACFYVACLLVEAGLSEHEMLHEMLAWNEMCAFPRWSYPELRHKVEDAMRHTSPRRLPQP